MAQARPLPRTGGVFLDPRGEDRSLRVSWHAESDVVVLSLWRDNLCVGTFRLAVDEVPDLIDLLRAGLAEAYTAARDRAQRGGALLDVPLDDTRPLGAG